MIELRQYLARLNDELGISSLDENKLDQAKACFICSMILVANRAETHNNLGITEFKLHAFENARQHFHRAIQINPRCFQAYYNLGNLCMMLNEEENAAICYRTAIELFPDYFEAICALGNCLIKQGECEEAIPLLQRSLEMKPEHFHSLNNLGICHLKRNNFEEAIKYFRRTIEANARCYQAHNNLGVALESFESIQCYEEAIACYRTALSLWPDYPDAHNNLGNVLYWLGSIVEAQREYKLAIELAPGRLDFYRNFAESWRFKIEDPYFIQLEKFEQIYESLSFDQRIEFHFTLGKALQDVGQEERAFQHFINGNRLKRQRVVYDEAFTLNWLNSITRVFTVDFMKGRAGLGHFSDCPVFVVGMMRSGTSLIEQILATHSLVFGAGERKEFERGLVMRQIEQYPGRQTGPPPKLEAIYPTQIHNLQGEDLIWLGSRYLRNVRSVLPPGDKQRIVDKMPLNFRLLGLIHLVFPNAKIIHAYRDPVDTCLSSYAKLYVEDHPYTYDLQELGRYYHAYDKLMSHWRSVLPPGTLLDVQYESLVNNFEHEARRMLDHLGLEWEESCRNFHVTQRPVRTASATQVRQPLYKSSIGKWRPESQLLQPLLDELSGR